MTRTDDRIDDASSLGLRGAGPGSSPDEERVRALLESRFLGEATTTARLGRFVVLGRIGSGGMGVVYAAYDGELDRKVAIKLLHGEMEEQGLRERLRREAQAMARLAHPNVATVFEIGEHQGRAFVAMEFVKGQTLRQWSGERARSWREVVQVYLQAGRGLAAAHEAGLVHRDFKPDNALIGADGRVRVMDFGLACVDAHAAEVDEPTLDGAMGRENALATPLTRKGTRVGTPAYMAPEQILGEPSDARSDQFAFCVALWEALSGVRPFAGRTLGELLAAIDGGHVIAPERGRMPRFVESAIRRGLRRQSSERHASLSALLGVLAHDPFQRRRRLLFAAGTVGLAAVAAGGNWLHTQAGRAGCEASGAAIAEIWNAEAAAQVAEGMRATGVVFAESAIERVVPKLDDYAEEWRTTRTTACLQAQEESTSAELQQRTDACLADARASLTELVEVLIAPDLDAVQRAVPAIGSLPRAGDCVDERELARRDPLPTDTERRSAIRQLQADLSAIRTTQLLGHYRDGLERGERVLADAETLDWPPLVADAHHNLGMSAMRLGDDARAEQEFEAAFYGAARAGNDALAGESGMHLTYVVGYRAARYEDARRWGRMAELMLDRADAGDIPRANLLGNLGLIELHQGNFAEAARQQQRALELAEAAYGTEHFDVATKLSNLGEAQRALGDTASATASYERAVQIVESTLGSDHPQIGYPLLGLAECAIVEGRFDDALAMFQRVLGIRQDALGPDHPLVYGALAATASAMTRLGDSAGALATLERAVALAEGRVGSEHPDVAGLLTDLGMLEEYLGRSDQSRAHLEHALAIKERTYGASHKELFSTLVNLGNVERDLQQTENARRHYARALKIGEDIFGDDDPRLAIALIGLGWTHVDVGDAAHGLPLLQRALELRERAYGLEHPLIANSLAHLADAEVRSKKPRDAMKHAERAVAIQRRILPPGHPELVFALTSVGRAARDADDLDVARMTLEETLSLAEAAFARGDLSATWLADVRFALATVLRRSDVDDARAMDLARAAAAAYREAGAQFTSTLREAEAFSRSRPGGRP